MNIFPSAPLATCIGLFLLLNSQTADAGPFGNRGAAHNPSPTTKAAQQYVEGSLGSSRVILRTEKPQKIGLKQALQARRAVGLINVLKLARSNVVPIFVQQRDQDEGNAVGVVVLSRGRKAPAVLGSVTRPFFILRSESGMAVLIPSGKFGERSGIGLAYNKAMITNLGNMIKPLDLEGF